MFFSLEAYRSTKNPARERMRSSWRSFSSERKVPLCIARVRVSGDVLTVRTRLEPVRLPSRKAGGATTGGSLGASRANDLPLDSALSLICTPDKRLTPSSNNFKRFAHSRRIIRSCEIFLDCHQNAVARGGRFGFTVMFGLILAGDRNDQARRLMQRL
jgi:hypothetical protein